MKFYTRHSRAIGLDFDNSEPKPWKKNSYACVFLFVLYPFLAAAAAMPTILWLVCVFAKYQTHIWQLWTCWCIFCILTWIGLAPSAAKKCRDIIHSPGQKRYKLAASCPFGDEQRLVGAFSGGRAKVHFQLDANDCLSTLFTFQGRRQQVTIYFRLK